MPKHKCWWSTGSFRQRRSTFSVFVLGVLSASFSVLSTSCGGTTAPPPADARTDRESWAPTAATSEEELQEFYPDAEVVRQQDRFAEEQALAKELLVALATGDRAALEKLMAPEVIVGISLGGRTRRPRSLWRIIKRDEAISRVMRRATPQPQVYDLFDPDKLIEVELFVYPKGTLPGSDGAAIEVFLPLARDGVMRLRHMTRWRSGIRVLVSRDEPKRVLGF